MHKYAVGDWMYGDQFGHFLRIKSLIYSSEGSPGYTVQHMKDKGEDEEFLFICNSGPILEGELKPVLNLFDSFQCLIAEFKGKYQDCLRQADSIDAQIEEVISVRDLFKEWIKPE